MAYVFSLGIAGYNDSSFCIKNVPHFADKYENGVRPSRTCDSYRYYTCHISHYCNGDKQCESEAAVWWLKPWRDLKTRELLDPIVATKEICDKEQQRNSSQKK